MLEHIIQYSIRHKIIVLLLALSIVAFGLYSLAYLPIGAVPDVTNNQVQIITTSRNLATEDVEKFLTYPVELEMANLPGVQEIRSISKFGLSVVTVVFDDDLGTYLPRQLIAEKIKSAEERIPAGFGQPFMGPITTGLGEIFQYIIEVDSAYRDVYSLADVRTIQDWIVRRQLSGIPGVVEVNSWGGFLKQYEVGINPEKLRSLQVSVSQVYQALEHNNSVAGGGYIEKINQTYFIRGEGLVGSLEDIETIVVDRRDGMPVFVRDVASVGFGHATRFGAITGNGEGEKVLGQVMMLKGANSKAVIEAVKQRVAEISPSLPPGISINAFLDRSELIGRTTNTIAENLVLGCLIVIFVVVLLLGNLRSGLVVASIIPLCLLFALSLMYLFGVDANLMSLGAIDFGIIIDGAVIIVEFIAFSMTSERAQLLGLPRAERQRAFDEIAHRGTSKMMHSAVFGQLIIIIVFIPILSLVGVEGKMFRPMALVFCFALMGAMILCFTYVPVMASLFIRPTNPDKRTISTRVIDFLQRSYAPLIRWALRFKGLVLVGALLLLVGAGYLFSRMGGEFVPTLDEGDFVIQPVLKTGTSLSNTVEILTRMERILLDFPEVEQVVSRIGAAEVPTDPMSMEESDVIIRLRPPGEWVSASNKDELANQFKAALSIIPGVEYEFTQPIEMRFNELITGVRADLAIKVFGEDLDLLYQIALEVENAIRDIEGAADISVDKTVGLPQMSVQYDRRKIAKYGLNVAELNDIIAMGFAGKPAGMVFEGEKQFDLVVRFTPEHLQDLEDLKMASVLLPNGSNLPLSEFATIRYTKGPAKISRDDTKRRVVVGVNVRDRDLESVVEDVQQAIEASIDLPTGYTIQYGGQFENLRTAKERLLVAVPIALLLIFILLYFAFHSVRDALLIYSAIPLAAVGGIVLLYLRDMPFSISAGVGFIALFGIAVLNGIVLIDVFKELKNQGVAGVNDRILLGTKKRLRPVLLTATAAALGFLPMAVSTSAGAEVQRPLATVVIGGLVTATVLTLIVLPVLYALFDRKGPSQQLVTVLLVVSLFGMPILTRAQAPEIDLDQAIAIALQNNKGLQAAAGRTERQRQLIRTAWDIGKTQLYYSYDENNIAPNDLPLHVLGIGQAIQFPSVYSAQRNVLEGQAVLAGDQYELDRRAVTRGVAMAYNEVAYWQQLAKQYAYLDSLYTALARAANRRYEQGATNYLEKLTAASKQQGIAVEVGQTAQRIEQAYIALHRWLQSDTTYRIRSDTLVRLTLVPHDTLNHPGIQYYEHARTLAQQQLLLEKRQLLPDLQLSLFRGTNGGEGGQAYLGLETGIAVPLSLGANQARVEANRTAIAIAEAEAANYTRQLTSTYRELEVEVQRLAEQLDYYDTTGKQLAEELRFHARRAFQSGEIDFLRYAQLLDEALRIEQNFLEALFQYNQAVLEANYLLN